MKNRVLALAVALGGLLAAFPALAGPWVVYEGSDGPGAGKHIVLISGVEEYRSEEALPELGQILAKHHGFKCTVLFAIDPKTGEINPNQSDNIPGLEALKSADLMIIFTRFRNLPDEQMAHIEKYIASGKPVIGLRTATHAFNIPPGKKYRTWSWNHRGEEFTQGFGRQILGETWISHHGRHGGESTRGVPAPGAADHPILRGIAPKSIWGDTDVYGVRLPQPQGCQPLVLGQVLQGMQPDDEPVEGKKNDPMMPIAWLKPYSYEGAEGMAFCSTLGAATDLVSEGSRRMLVNTVYYLLDMEVPKAGTKVDLVGEYEPNRFGFGKFTKGVKPSDWAWPVN